MARNPMSESPKFGGNPLRNYVVSDNLIRTAKNIISIN